MIFASAPLEAQLLIMLAYAIIMLQFAIRWRSLQKRGGRGRISVGLLMGIFLLRIVSELARLLGFYDDVQNLTYWLLVIIAWSFVVWNHAGTIADALSEGDERRSS